MWRRRTTGARCACPGACMPTCLGRVRCACGTHACSSRPSGSRSASAHARMLARHRVRAPTPAHAARARRYAKSYDGLDGGGAATVLGFDDLREQLLGTVRGCRWGWRGGQPAKRSAAAPVERGIGVRQHGSRHERGTASSPPTATPPQPPAHAARHTGTRRRAGGRCGHRPQSKSRAVRSGRGGWWHQTSMFWWSRMTRATGRCVCRHPPPLRRKLVTAAFGWRPTL